MLMAADQRACIDETNTRKHIHPVSIVLKQEEIVDRRAMSVASPHDRLSSSHSCSSMIALTNDRNKSRRKSRTSASLPQRDGQVMHCLVDGAIYCIGVLIGADNAWRAFDVD